MKPQWDLILVGAGLANGLIAWRLRHRQPHLKVLLLEAGPQPGGNHTWSFHEPDLTPEQLAWLSPLVAHRWHGYDVRFPNRERTLPGGYLSLTSACFSAMLRQKLGETLRCNAPVSQLAPGEVTLENGERLTARAVIDGRGPKTDEHVVSGFQAFIGQQWQLSQPHGLTRPILMDATVDQQQGYRFVYTLPLSPDTLLIEDTYYTDHPEINQPQVRANIHDYAAAQGWRLASLQREEHGCLPITLAGDVRAFWRSKAGQPASGLRAGLFHATTGYSLPHAVRLADLIAWQTDFSHSHLYALIASHAQKTWRQQRFFRLLNRMLFLAGRPDARWRVMERFYGLNAGLIARFYAGRLTPADIARILSGKPPVPVGEAMLAILKQPLRQRGR
ncbi:lycopene beta-cyclase CrtY [Franconibacter helveticus]|uniref:lycopene beta-cyclase CrtY n=1 Tax=Franconibacter helveticus TaxID=357240 RepID=UPI00066BAA13|nr:lycopene beta-cyclase CrtY [Franconibacter helveticus]MDU6925167.1 lycopene beta-cyclase CrtY [Franconibacter helveticus]